MAGSPFEGKRYGDNFGQRGNYRYWDHNIEFGRDLGTIKLKILAFQEKNDLKVYLEWEKKVKWSFKCHKYPKPKKVKLVVIAFTEYVIVWWDQLVKNHRRNYEKQVDTRDEMKFLMRKRFVSSHYCKESYKRL